MLWGNDGNGWQLEVITVTSSHELFRVLSMNITNHDMERKRSEVRFVGRLFVTLHLKKTRHTRIIEQGPQPDGVRG